MMTFDELHPLFERALDDAGAGVLRAATEDLRLPTPCTGWDLGTLVGHMIGQNDGFAAAVRTGDAPASAYAPVELAPAQVSSRWSESVEGLSRAFRTAEPTAPVRLAEVGLQVTVTTALTMLLLDCAVHAWDVAVALGEDYRPDEEIVRVVHESARVVAARPGGAPGFFAAPREVGGEDLWSDALRLLGR